MQLVTVDDIREMVLMGEWMGADIDASMWLENEDNDEETLGQLLNGVATALIQYFDMKNTEKNLQLIERLLAVRLGLGDLDAIEQVAHLIEDSLGKHPTLVDATMRADWERANALAIKQYQQGVPAEQIAEKVATALDMRMSDGLTYDHKEYHRMAKELVCKALQENDPCPVNRATRKINPIKLLNN